MLLVMVGKLNFIVDGIKVYCVILDYNELEFSVPMAV